MAFLGPLIMLSIFLIFIYFVIIVTALSRLGLIIPPAYFEWLINNWYLIDFGKLLSYVVNFSLIFTFIISVYLQYRDWVIELRKALIITNIMIVIFWVLAVILMALLSNGAFAPLGLSIVIIVFHLAYNSFYLLIDSVLRQFLRAKLS